MAVVTLLGVAGHAACDRIFRIGVNESEPLYYKNEKFVYTGFVYDLVREMAARTGCRFVPEQMNRSRVYLDLRTSRIDMVVVTIKNRLFDEIALFMPLYRFRREALVPAGKGRYSDFNQLLMDPDLRFAILPRAAFLFTPEEEQRLTKEKRLVTTPSLQEAYQFAQRNKNVAVVQPDFVNDFFIRKLKMEKQFYLLSEQSAHFKMGIYYLPARVKDAEAQMLQKVLDEIRRDGTLKRFLARYSKRAPEVPADL